MNRFAIVLLFAALQGCQALSPAMSMQDLAGKPTVFCEVIKEPNPILMGVWRCVFVRFIEESNEFDSNPIEYKLIRYGDEYALYFSRTTRSGKKRYLGWRNWTINGNEIYSDTGVRIFVENGAVYFNFENGTPERMTRVSSG